MKNRRLIFLAMALVYVISASFLSGCKKEKENDPDTVKDIDGNSYSIVSIGTQQWFGENLRTTKYNDGSDIPNVTVNTAWEALSTPAYAWWENNSGEYKNPYGGYYNWYAVSSGKLCPAGWHVPDDAEWTTLSDYLGGVDVAGGKMKETGLTHWWDPNEGATNSSGFTGIGSGQRSYNGNFNNMFEYGEFWSSTSGTGDVAKSRALGFNQVQILNSSPGTFKDKRSGLAVRCLKD